MPLGLAKSILTTEVAAGGGGGNPFFSMAQLPNSGNGAALQASVGSGNFFGENHNFSGTFWFRATSSEIDSPASRIFDAQDSQERDQITIQISTTNFQVIGVTNNAVKFATWQPADFATNYLDDEWHHIAFHTNFDSPSFSLYVDGSNTGFTSTPGTGITGIAGLGTKTRVLTDENNTTAYHAANEFGGDLAYFWLDQATVNWSTNISNVYSSGYVDPGTTGTFGGSLSQPDVFWYVDSNPAVAYGGSRGSGSTLTQGSGSISASATGGPA